MLGVLIIAKLLVIGFWLTIGIGLLMVSVMAFDAPGSDKEWINYLPGIVTSSLALLSAWFIIFVW